MHAKVGSGVGVWAMTSEDDVGAGHGCTAQSRGVLLTVTAELERDDTRIESRQRIEGLTPASCSDDPGCTPAERSHDHPASGEDRILDLGDRRGTPHLLEIHSGRMVQSLLTWPALPIAGPASIHPSDQASPRAR